MDGCFGCPILCAGDGVPVQCLGDDTCPNYGRNPIDSTACAVAALQRETHAAIAAGGTDA